MDMIQQIARERADEAGLKFLIDQVAEYIKSHPYLWHGGDGEGGHVHLWLDEAVEDHGFAATASRRIGKAIK